MHKVMVAACRRTAGSAAGLLLGAGLAGGVLLTPGTAFAGTTVATTTAITGTTQSADFPGTTLNVQVSVTPASGSDWPSGAVKVSDGSGSCLVTLAQDGAKAVGVGSCNIGHLPSGSRTLTASYAGSSSFGSSVSGPVTVTIGRAPVFVADSPALTASNGDLYSYTFRAKGDPAPSYALGSDSPSWLHINASSGTVWGTVPDWATSFSYTVTAANGVGSATAGPYRVHVRHHHAAVATNLSCTSKVFSGRQGSCTLSVTNVGRLPAPNVIAQVNLPSQLRAVSCGHFWWDHGCRISGNTALENLGTLRPGQTRTLSVVFVAKSSHGIWGWHHFHTITVKVTGSAAWGFWGFGGRSFSTAYVTIVPKGWWWAF